MPRRLAIAAVAIALALAPGRAGAIATAIEHSTEALRDAAGRCAATPAQMDALQQAIARGDEASKGLRGQIADLEKQKAALERIQTVLTSGLIGALVTAVVAGLGAFVNLRGAGPERDLKRLEVLEKAYELKAKGVALPRDISEELSVRTPGGRRQRKS